MFIPDPGSDFFPSWILDPNFFHPGSRILIKEFKYFNPKKWFLSSRKYDLGCSSRIRIPDSDPGFGSWLFAHPGSRIQGLKRYRIRIRNTGWNYVSPPSSPASECVFPLEPKGRGATLACGGGGGGRGVPNSNDWTKSLALCMLSWLCRIYTFHFGGWQVVCRQVVYRVPVVPPSVTLPSLTTSCQLITHRAIVNLFVTLRRPLSYVFSILNHNF